jgi:hypothetical protein
MKAELTEEQPEACPGWLYGAKTQSYRPGEVTQRVPDLEGFKDGRPPAGQGLEREATHR